MYSKVPKHWMHTKRANTHTHRGQKDFCHDCVYSGMFATKAYGRRRPMMVLFCIAGVALVIVASITAAVANPSVYAVMTLIFMGKFGISGTYGIVFLFITEIFPTNSRSIALGMCNIGARMGSIWSPYAVVRRDDQNVQHW